MTEKFTDNPIPGTGQAIEMPLFQKSLVGVLASNIVTMSLMNFFELPVEHLGKIYVACFALSILIISRANLSIPKLGRSWSIFSIAMAILLFLPRLPYFFEPNLGFSVDAFCWDDWWHFQELASLINGDYYPPRSTFDSNYFLGFYYAPWMLGAALSTLGLTATVKQALAATYIVYFLLASYIVAYSSNLFFSRPKDKAIFASLCWFYSGFDLFFWLANSIYKSDFRPVHSEWWGNAIFGLKIQFSNFFTLNLWVIHHLVGAICFTIALWLLSLKNSNAWGRLLAGILISSSLFSSSFAFLGGISLLISLILTRRIEIKSAYVSMLSFVLTLLPLAWIYLSRSSYGSIEGFRFGILGRYSSPVNALFFILFVVLELGPLVWLAVKGSGRREKIILLAGSLIYISSTMFISYSGANNYAMRGAIIPIWVLIYLATPEASRFFASLFSSIRNPFANILAASAVAFYMLGGVLEYSSFTRSAILYFKVSRNSKINQLALQANINKSPFNYSKYGTYVSKKPSAWYLFDYHSSRKADLHHADKEIMIPDHSSRITAKKLIGKI
jgi:hypothetical protein